MTSKQPVTQEYLDSSQYLTSAILQYEQVYGRDFVSPGGRPLANELIARLQLEPGAAVLDVGCGLGGSAFIMARDSGWQVDGIDLSHNMLALAQQRLREHGLANQVELRWGDCLQLDREQHYDAIYSRDVFLHIHDKVRLIAVLHKSLSHNGKLLFTDYCCGPQPWGASFRDYVDERNYCLHTIEEYLALITAAGFMHVTGADLSTRFCEILQADLDRIDTLDLAPTERAKLRDSWRLKLARAQTGDHRWGLFSATRGEINA